MRIMHLSDLHIGKRLNEFSLLEDQAYIFKQIVDIAKEQKAEAVIIAGDVFDKSIPSSAAVQLFDDFLNEWHELGLPVLIISGNHDSAERVAFGGRLFEQSGVYISPVYDGHVKQVTLTDDFGSVNFYLLPFIKPSAVRPFFPDLQIETYNDAVKAALSGLPVNPEERNIIVAHQFVTGAAVSDSEEIFVGGLDNIASELFDDFDYAALGHIHTPQQIGRESVRYCGTPLKYSFSEAAQDKSVTIIDFKSKGDLTVETHRLMPKHDLRKIKGLYNDLVSRENYSEENRYDYISATLTDEQEIPQAIAKLRVIYPNIMQLAYDNVRSRISQTIESSDVSEMKTPLELFDEFYALQNNQPMDEEQRSLMAQLISSIWEEKA